MSNDDVLIGKNIIEILTTGMYHNPLVIFREYIQNSIDAINEAVDLGLLAELSDGDVQIYIDSTKKYVTFEDNGVGVPSETAWSILTSIAASKKDRTKNLGFRGIGRLAGLAYCDELIIETSYKGEPTKTILRWDGKKLRNIIGDRTDTKLASEVIKDITTFENNLSESKDAHYFKVKLQNVKNEKLLNVSSVQKYLRMVAPVNFYTPRFMFTKPILEGLADRDVECDGYRIFVNMEELFKGYRNFIYKNDGDKKRSIDEIIDIDFIELHSKDNQLLAVGWYTLTKQMQLIPAYNEAWGIRFRKGNIQIGDEFTFQKFFRENRFHRYFYGEIHVIHEELFPNGQRDYFDECELLSEFEDQLQKFANKLHGLCRKASDWNTAEKSVASCSTEVEKFEKTFESQEFYSPQHEEEEKEKLEKAKEKAEKAEKKLHRLREQAEDDVSLKRFVDYRTNTQTTKPEATVEPKPEDKEPKNGKKYKANKLSKLSKKEQKLVGEIYEIIRTVLSPDLQNNLIYKIEERFGPANNGE
ncbi:ATP-binding protein [Desulfogranum marinum]|uniref:ATP-binding protein n=1 Tax=Desulfogranum marinum TaxID=453220 RepID=UPI0019655D5D|nr:ATP-binding protein [Desulfogranum marinum]MBM9514783.1 ATP-binding protein [Desulfogranum marinum]